MRRKLADVVAASAGPAALVAMAAIQLGPGLREGLAPPISWDHGAHLGKAMMTAQQLLPSLRGFSDSVEAGVPMNELYSLGGPAFVLLVRLFTSWLPWTATYALAVLAVRALVGLSVYRLVRAADGSRFAGFLGGAFALADHGDHSEGGWFYDVQFGVWPVSLAIALLFFGAAELVARARRGDRSFPILGAACFGLALVTHQMALLGLAAFGCLFALNEALERAGGFGRAAATFAATTLAAFALAAFWLVPMLAGSDEMARHGQLYRSYLELGEGAASGSFVLRSGPFTGVLCALAVLVGAFAGGARRLYALLVGALLVASARDAVVEGGLLRALPGLGAIMFPRLLMLAKPLEFALVGLFLVEAASPVARGLRERLGEARGRVALAVALALLAPFLPGIAKGIHTVALERHVATTVDDLVFPHFVEYAAFERARRRGFYRVAYLNPHSHLFQGAPAFTGVPAHKIGALIAEVFGNVTGLGSPEALDAMNVRSIVAVGGLPPQYAHDVRRVAQFGPIEVYDRASFDPRLALDPSGSSVPRVVSHGHRTTRIEPRGARTLVLRRAYTRHARGEADGRPVTLRPRRVEGAHPLRILEIDVPAGARTVTVDFDPPRTLDRVVGVASALTWLGFAFVLVARTSRARKALDAFHDALGARIEAWLTPSRIVTVASSVLVALAVIAFVRTPRFDARGALGSATVRIEAPGGSFACDQPREEGRPGVRCPGPEWQYVGPVVQAVGGQLRDCVWAHPAGSAGSLVIRFPRARLGGRLDVSAGIADEAMPDGGEAVRMTLSLDGRGLGEVAAPFRPEWVSRSFAVTPGEHVLELRVTARETARRAFCFSATSP